MTRDRSAQLDATEVTPPNNIDAERCTLCTILLDPNVLDDVIPILGVEDFYDSVHRKIFRACLTLHAAGKRCDVHLVGAELRRVGAKEQEATVDGLVEIAGTRPTAANAKYFAEIVREFSQRRRLLHVSMHGLTAARDEQTPFREILSDLESQMLGVADREADEQRTRPLGDVLVEAMAEHAARQEGREVGVLSGFRELDQLTGGFRPGEVTILAGLSSMGKTAFALNCALHAAAESKIPTLLVSLEMTAGDLASRLAATRSGVSGNSLETGTATADQRRKFMAACNELSSVPLIIDDRSTRNVAEIAAVARRTKRKHGLGLLVIDYLQLIAADNPRDSRNEQVSTISRRVKAIARDLGVPVILLAQLNREPARGGEDMRPKLHHLRDSGAIEQDADVVIFVHRGSYFGTGTVAPMAPDPCLLLVQKHRNGPTGEVRLLWTRGCQRFTEPSSDPFAPEFDQQTKMFDGENNNSPAKRNGYHRARPERRYAP